MFVTQQQWAAKWWLLPPCSPTVQSYPCRSSLNRVWFHRNCWTNSFRKRCTASFLLQKMRALATRRKSWRPSSTGAVGAFCKITVWAHLGAPWPGPPDKQRHFQDPTHLWQHGIHPPAKASSWTRYNSHVWVQTHTSPSREESVRIGCFQLLYITWNWLEKHFTPMLLLIHPVHSVDSFWALTLYHSLRYWNWTRT